MQVTLAPIQGLTIALYRHTFHQIFGGIDRYYSPFITTTGPDKMSSKLFKDILPQANDPNIDLVPQLLSNNGSDFHHYASYIHNLGYEEINWNMGCPYPTVTKKKRGSGILAYPDLVSEFLETVCSLKSYEVSIKMRLGYDQPEEGLEIIHILNQYPLKEVTIHGRLGIQKYEGTVDLDHFATMLEASAHPTAYNGDIFTLEDYKQIHDRFPTLDHVMLARGVLMNPFLASEIKGKAYTLDQKADKLFRFHQEIFHQYAAILSGEKHLIDRMKEFWLYLSQSMDPSGKAYKAIKKAKNKEAYLSAVQNLFDAYH